jgi:hypothetical protein
MLERERNYGVFKGKITANDEVIDDGVFYLKEIDEKWRRKYEIKNPPIIGITRGPISSILRL